MGCASLLIINHRFSWQKSIRQKKAPTITVEKATQIGGLQFPSSDESKGQENHIRKKEYTIHYADISPIFRRRPSSIYISKMILDSIPPIILL